MAKMCISKSNKGSKLLKGKKKLDMKLFNASEMWPHLMLHYN